MELDWEAVYVWQPETLTGWRRCWCVEVLPWASSSSPSWISSRKNFWTASASFRSGSCSTKNIQPAGRRSDHSSLSDLTGSHSATYRNTFRGFKEIYFVNYMMWTGFLMNRQNQNVTHNNNTLLDNPPSQRDQVWVFSFNKQNKKQVFSSEVQGRCSPLPGLLSLWPPSAFSSLQQNNTNSQNPNYHSADQQQTASAHDSLEALNKETECMSMVCLFRGLLVLCHQWHNPDLSHFPELHHNLCLAESPAGRSVMLNVLLCKGFMNESVDGLPRCPWANMA